MHYSTVTDWVSLRAIDLHGFQQHSTRCRTERTSVANSHFLPEMDDFGRLVPEAEQQPVNHSGIGHRSRRPSNDQGLLFREQAVGDDPQPLTTQDIRLKYLGMIPMHGRLRFTRDMGER